jgi:hypothetical protein
MALVDIDVSDYIDELDTQDMIDELFRRANHGDKIANSYFGGNPETLRFLAEKCNVPKELMKLINEFIEGRLSLSEALSIRSE